MAFLSWKERLTIPDYTDPKRVRSGRVTIERDRCDGCGLCVLICPGGCLYMEGEGKGRKAHMSDAPVPDCMSCNDCAAICEADAITADYGYDFGGYFKAIHRGELAPPRNF